jgi:hypothetical protein
VVPTTTLATIECDKQVDDSLLFSIAEEVYHDRMATAVKLGNTEELSHAHHEPALFDSCQNVVDGKTRSWAGTSA